VNKALNDRRMVLLLPSAFLTSLGIGIANLGMLFVVKDSYKASPSAVGAFAALWAIAYFVGCIALRPLQKKISARTSMAAMNLGTAALFAFHLAVPGLASAFVAFGLYGFITALFWPRLMGWLSSGLEGAALGAATGAFSFSWSAGGVISPYLSGLLTERGLFLPVYAAIGVFGATGVFILATRRIVPSPALAAPGPAAEETDHSTTLRYPAWIGVFLIYALASVFFNIFPLFAKDELGLPESKIGLLLLVRAVFMTGGFWLFGRLDSWHFKRRLILLPVGVVFLLDLAFIGLRSPLAFALLLAVTGFFQAMAYNNSIFYGASGARDRERRMTIHEALLTAGQILGSVAGGLLYQGSSWASVFRFLAPVFALGLAAQLLFLRRRT